MHLLLVQEGNVEYKRSLVHPNIERLEHLTSQLKWRYLLLHHHLLLLSLFLFSSSFSSFPFPLFLLLFPLLSVCWC